MTNIGVQFVNAQENIRHNLAIESLQGKEIAIKQGTLDETIRHNMVLEDVSRRDVGVKEGQLLLNRLEYEEVTKPLARSQMAVNSSMVTLNKARTAESKANTLVNVAKTGLIEAQTKTEGMKFMSETERAKLLQAQAKEAAERYYQSALKSDYLVTYYSARDNFAYQSMSAVSESIGGLLGSVVKAIK